MRLIAKQGPCGDVMSHDERSGPLRRLPASTSLRHGNFDTILMTTWGKLGQCCSREQRSTRQVEQAGQNGGKIPDFKNCKYGFIDTPSPTPPNDCHAPPSLP